jgi:hypothetical protein
MSGSNPGITGVGISLIIGSLTIVTPGIYYFSHAINLNNTSGQYPIWGNSYISGANVPGNASFPFSGSNSLYSIVTSGSIIINATASTYTISFVSNVDRSFYSVSAGFSYFQAVRIA